VPYSQLFGGWAVLWLWQYGSMAVTALRRLFFFRMAVPQCAVGIHFFFVLDMFWCACFYFIPYCKNGCYKKLPAFVFLCALLCFCTNGRSRSSLAPPRPPALPVAMPTPLTACSD
jgi:ABC-type spermidine/putrescine transport system permease subunit II